MVACTSGSGDTIVKVIECFRSVERRGLVTRNVIAARIASNAPMAPIEPPNTANEFPGVRSGPAARDVESTTVNTSLIVVCFPSVSTDKVKVEFEPNTVDALLVTKVIVLVTKVIEDVSVMALFVVTIEA